MRISKWGRTKKYPSSRPGYMIHVTEHEAMTLIRSLAEQFETESSNSGRAEFITDKGEDFSIAIDFGGKP